MTKTPISKQKISFRFNKIISDVSSEYYGITEDLRFNHTKAFFKPSSLNLSPLDLRCVRL